MNRIVTLLLKSLLLSLFASNSALAIQVDKMFEWANEDGIGNFVITNDKKVSYFIETRISEIKVTDSGGIERIEYTRENIDDWDIAISNHKVIVEPNRSKSIGVRAICGNDCDFSTDKMYEISFIPKPYNPNDPEFKNRVNLFIGYSPVFVIPTTVPNVAYKIENQGEILRVKNNGNTLIKVEVDQCEGSKSSLCRSTYTILAGRLKEFTLAENMQSEKLNITLVNYDESYREKFALIDEKSL